ncbi:MAG: branched-chain amino acid ABC transporter permease [Nitriliruptorales bacterium]|nr:branched-chain amino acid ABC transporter permease [Nitriliruptorales bacterium]
MDRERLALVLISVTIGLFLSAAASAFGAESSPSPSPSPTANPTTLFGFLRVDGEPVEGVEVAVSLEGEEVETVATDEEGQWQVRVPAGGEFEVEVLTDSLPDGTSLANPDNNPITITVGEGRRQAVGIRLVAGEGGGPAADGGIAFGRYIDLTVDGLKLGTIIAITSIGLSLIYGVTGLINFAHGELVVFGAAVAWFLNASGAGPGMPLVFAAIIAVAAGGALGWGLESSIFRPLRRRKTGALALLLLTIGLSIGFRHIILMFIGGAGLSYTDYRIQREVAFGPVSITPKDLAIVIISIALMVGVGLVLQKTRLGTAMRAVADNRDLAESSGIDVEKIILATWIGGAALAALGGIFQGLTSQVKWDMGFNLLLLMFAGVILGGIGTAYGAMVGGLVIGVITQLSTEISIELKLAFAFMALILVLLVRPQGLLGREERVG